MMDPRKETELEDFLKNWDPDENGCRQAFVRIKRHLQAMTEAELDFVPRPGVTYSLRAKRAGQSERPLFALIDVIDENPRWLSVCFYEDLITDPEQRGDMVPAGILGEDGYCFDLESLDADFVAYLEKRIDEACENASA